MLLEICVVLLFISVAFAYYLLTRVARSLRKDILQLSEEYKKHSKLLQSSNAELHSLLFEIDYIYAELNTLNECSNGYMLKRKLEDRVKSLKDKYECDIIIQCNNVDADDDKYDMIINVAYDKYLCYKSYTSYTCAKIWPLNIKYCKFSKYMMQDNCTQWVILPSMVLVKMK